MNKLMSILLLLVGVSVLEADDETLRDDVPPGHAQSTVHPRRFGHPGGVGKTRGWYIFRSYDASTGRAVVEHEGRREKYNVVILPWTSTYRHLVYGGSPEELLPGERFNPSFDPKGEVLRHYMTAFQDEICQMKGHGQYWEVLEKSADGKFRARTMAGDKPLDDRIVEFQLGEQCRSLRKGKEVKGTVPNVGEKLYMTHTVGEKYGVRTVRLILDIESAEVIKQEEMERVEKRVEKEGLGGFVEKVDGHNLHGLIFPRHWSQANPHKPGETILISLFDQKATAKAPRIVVHGVLRTRKNLGKYGSGSSEVVVELQSDADAKIAAKWVGSTIVSYRFETEK